MTIKRRNFLKIAGLSASTLALPLSGVRTSHAQTLPPKTFVNVFLRGGADGFYFVPTLGPGATTAEKNRLLNHTDGLKRNFFNLAGEYYDDHTMSTATPALSLAGQDHFVLHPAMTGFHNLYNAGQLAIIHGVGGSRNLSHFVSMDAVERAQPYRSEEGNSRGWLHDTLPHLTQATASELTGVGLDTAKQESLAGYDHSNLCSAIASTTTGYELPGGITYNNMLRNMFSLGGNQSHQLIRDSVQSAVAIDDVLRDIAQQEENLQQSFSNESLYTGIGSTSFVNHLRDAVRLIKSGHNVGAINIDVGGWDTHSNLVNRLWSLGTILSDGIAAFYQDLTTGFSPCTHEDVCTLIMSEFGRTLDHLSEDTTGTDHGDAGVAYVIGGGVNGGAVYADKLNPKWRTVDNIASRSSAARYYWPVTTDYRSIFDSIISNFMVPNITTNELEAILGQVQDPNLWNSINGYAAGVYTGPVQGLFS